MFLFNLPDWSIGSGIYLPKSNFTCSYRKSLMANPLAPSIISSGNANVFNSSFNSSFTGPTWQFVCPGQSLLSYSHTDSISVLLILTDIMFVFQTLPSRLLLQFVWAKCLNRGIIPEYFTVCHTWSGQSG